MPSFRDALLEADDSEVRSKLVETPYGTVQVREMTAADFDAFMEVMEGSVPEGAPADQRDKVRIAAMVYAAAYDPDTGERVFSKDDVEWLKARPFRQISPLYTAANELNQVDDPKKSSGTSDNEPSGDSPEASASPQSD